MSVDGEVVSVDRKMRVSVDEDGVSVGRGASVSVDRQLMASIDAERISLRIERSKLAGSSENKSWDSLLLLVLLGMYLKRQEKNFVSENKLK